MKIQIRRGVFETNSSSVHSISITKNEFKNPLPKQFTINCNGEFGWETCTYNDSSSKAAYLYQAIIYYPIINKTNITFRQEILQGLMDKFIANLESYGIEVYCKYRFTKVHRMEYMCGDKKYNYDYADFVDENGNENKDKGYLDHGGNAKEFVDYVLSSPENTVKFIFDNRCYIETGNDNDDDYWDNEKDNDEESIIFEKGN